AWAARRRPGPRWRYRVGGVRARNASDMFAAPASPAAARRAAGLAALNSRDPTRPARCSRAGSDDRVERHDEVALVGMVGEDLDGGLDLLGCEPLAEADDEAVFLAVADGGELVGRELRRDDYPRDRDRAHALVADPQLALGGSAALHDAEGHLRRKDDDVALDASEDGQCHLRLARARRVERQRLVEAPQRGGPVEPH